MLPVLKRQCWIFKRRKERTECLQLYFKVTSKRSGGSGENKCKFKKDFSCVFSRRMRAYILARKICSCFCCDLFAQEVKAPFFPFRLSNLVVAQLCPTVCDPMDCSAPGSSVLHHLLELAQTHVHWVGDGIHPSHPLSSPSPAFDLSQHQGLF